MKKNKEKIQKKYRENEKKSVVSFMKEKKTNFLRKVEFSF